MLLRIDHRTRYDYEQPVSYSPHFVRLFPRTEPGRLVQKLSFTTNADASVQYRRDLFDNNFARCFYPNHSAELFFDYALEIELQEQNPFDFLLDNDAADYPFTHDPQTAARLTPYLSPPASESGQVGGPSILPLPFWEKPAAPRPDRHLADQSPRRHPRPHPLRTADEGAAHPPAETLRLGHGSCRDFAVLLANVLRELGLAARLVSGYLCEFGSEEGNRRAEGAMHLWTEVYLPGAGWTGIDATNGVFCDHLYIATAVGLTSAEVTPIGGRYFSGVVVPAKNDCLARLATAVRASAACLEPALWPFGRNGVAFIGSVSVCRATVPVAAREDAPSGGNRDGRPTIGRQKLRHYPLIHFLDAPSRFCYCPTRTLPITHLRADRLQSPPGLPTARKFSPSPGLAPFHFIPPQHEKHP